MRKELEDFASAGQVSRADTGRRLKLVRLSFDLTQNKMAEIMQMKLSAYQHQERGRSFPNAAQVDRLHRELGVDHNFLYKGMAGSLSAEAIEALAAGAQTHASDLDQGQDTSQP